MFSFFLKNEYSHPYASLHVWVGEGIEGCQRGSSETFSDAPFRIEVPIKEIDKQVMYIAQTNRQDDCIQTIHWKIKQA